ncbi:MAG: recombinase family protein [Burkholderiales bacterium]|nr:recombinase family protein [Burkholderiales bacterium]
MASGKFVAYYRVSTREQGRSGLGLEAQREAVASFLNGGSWQLIAEYTEVESGKRNDRKELQRALAHCRVTGATLVIAKLDRLARNVAFVSKLMEEGVEFVAADFPKANSLTVHILAAVAQHEAKMISDRTKAALAATKARGTKLGGYRAGAEERGKAVAAHGRAALAEKAQKAAANYGHLIDTIQAKGITSASGIARELNAMGIETPRGGKWQAVSVQRLMARLG